MTATRDVSPGPAVRQVDPRLVVTRGGLREYLGDFVRRVKGGELGSIPVVIGLVIIWAIFQSMDSGFLSPSYLTGISVDIVATGMMAVGIVFVLLLGEIDLSIGSVSAACAAVLAVANLRWGFNEWESILLAVVAGMAMGLLHGFFFAKVGVPAFIVTLAGLLGWWGLMLWVLGKTGSYNLDNSSGIIDRLTGTYFVEVFWAYLLAGVVTVGYFLLSLWGNWRRWRADIPAQGSVLVSALLGVALTVVAGAFNGLRSLLSSVIGRALKRKVGHRTAWAPSVTVGGPLEVATRSALLGVVVFGVAWVFNQARGLPLAPVIFLVFVVGLDFVLRHTSYGRKVFAVGGNIEAARRAGINVAAVRMSVFAISGTMAAIGGVFFASVNQNITKSGTGQQILMNAIAAAVIGGTSLFGGRGSTYSALLGVLVIQSIAAGMNLVGITDYAQYMVTGIVLLAAVVIDSLSRRSQKASGRA